MWCSLNITLFRIFAVCFIFFIWKDECTRKKSRLFLVLHYFDCKLNSIPVLFDSIRSHLCCYLIYFGTPFIFIAFEIEFMQHCMFALSEKRSLNLKELNEKIKKNDTGIIIVICFSYYRQPENYLMDGNFNDVIRMQSL